MKCFIFRNYEEYYPINNEPGFSFTPPIINKEISFNISSNTLDDGQNYFYDVDSGSYSQLEFACGFQDGYDKSLSNFETVQVNIEKCKYKKLFNKEVKSVHKMNLVMCSFNNNAAHQHY